MLAWCSCGLGGFAFGGVWVFAWRSCRLGGLFFGASGCSGGVRVVWVVLSPCINRRYRSHGVIIIDASIGNASYSTRLRVTTRGVVRILFPC